MQKTINGRQLREIAFDLFNGRNWDRIKRTIKLNPRSLYNLIKLKNSIDEQEKVMEESMIVILEQEGCKKLENGNYHIPDEKTDRINKLFGEFLKKEFTFEYEPITVSETDNIPTEVFDALFDFIEMK